VAVIYFIRHGQASFGQEEYDQLSGVGERQASILGRHIQRVMPGVDLICSGGMRRQDQTAEIARESMGDSPPPLRTHEAFSEYDHVALFRAYLPGFIREDGLQTLSMEDLLKVHRTLERALRAVLNAWMENRPHDGPPVRSWSSFCDGVVAGLETLVDSLGPKARVAVFTSGGVITAVLRGILGLSHLRTLGLTLSIYNASVTQVYCPGSANITSSLLLGYNNITHLEMLGDRDLITFR
jgi:broad specificity phosphatase PhoE